MLFVQIDSYGTNWAEISWDDFASLWPLATHKPEKYPQDPWQIESGPTNIGFEQAMQLANLGVVLRIKPLPGQMIVKMQDRHQWDHDVRPRDIQEAKAVQISVPDLGLMYIKKVCVMVDCCTDQLQDMLDAGWRILAVCPPNAARRPDYILGHTNNTDTNNQ